MDLWAELLVCAGGIATLGSAVTYLSKGARPIKRVSERLTALEEHEKKDLERFADLDRELEKIHGTDQAIMSALFALLSHAMSDNDTGKMQKAMEKLQEHLIEK